MKTIFWTIVLVSLAACVDDNEAAREDAGVAGDSGSLDGVFDGEESAGYTGERATVERTLADAATAGCERFFTDCSALCDQPFYFCGENRTQCRDEFVRSTLDGFDAPFADPALLAQCIADVSAAACVDIPPDTPACENLIVEGCPGDTDAHAPYTHLRAVEGALPGELQAFLCDGVTEWFALDLAAGDAVRVVGLEGPSVGFVSVGLHAPDGDEPFQLQVRNVDFEPDRSETLGPVDAAGPHLLTLGMNGQPTAQVRVMVEVVAPEAP